MQGKILIADAIATNRIVMKVKLKKAYYDVVQASTQDEAVEMARAERPDLVIAAMDLPGGGAADLADGLRQHPQTEHIPILATGCQVPTDERLRTLRAGVRDILNQPIEETLLLGRVRSVIREHNAAAEWQMREDTCRALGLAEEAEVFEQQGSCVLQSADRTILQRAAHQLRPVLGARLTLATPVSAMATMAEDTVPDVFILLLPEDHGKAVEDLRVISTLRASARLRHVGIIVVQAQHDPALGADALDLGADDLMTNGFNPAELALRTRALMRRKRMGEQLRATVRTGLQAAVFDPLTGLYNRRYAMPHLARVAAEARSAGRPFAVLAADLDHFKRINDIYGHAAGDAVLVEVATRLRGVLRPSDMVARIGGEEFLVILPGTGKRDAHTAATRICDAVAARPFAIPHHPSRIDVTISIGMAVYGGTDRQLESPEEIGAALLTEADRALYDAKGLGRNQVTHGRPAA